MVGQYPVEFQQLNCDENRRFLVRSCQFGFASDAADMQVISVVSCVVLAVSNIDNAQFVNTVA